MSLWSRIKNALRPPSEDGGIREELEFHLEMDRVNGRDAREAKIHLGNTTQIREEVYCMTTISFIEETARNVRMTFRVYRHKPGFAAAAIATLALGIGASTAVFSVVNGVLIRPLPYPEADQLIVVRHTADLGSSPFLYFTEREQSRTLAGIGAYNSGTATLTGHGEPEQVQTVSLTSDVLPLLGVRPFLGRYFTEEDDRPGGNNTVVIAHGLWQRRFGGDPGILGSTIMLDGQPWSVVGITPPRFRFLNRKADAFLPRRLDRSRTTAGGFFVSSIARMKAGVTLDRAAADINRMIPIAKASFPPMPGLTAEQLRNMPLAANLTPLKEEVVGNVGSALWLLMGTIGVVMLIVCGNVANLILLRTESRTHELSIRAALGAGRRNIVTELLTESLVLCGTGGLVGIGFAYASLRFLISIAPATLPRLDEVALDSAALSFALFVSLISGAFCALLPLVRYSKPVAGALRSGRTLGDTRVRIRTRNMLVVAQVGFAVMLLIGSGLMIQTFLNMSKVDPGFAGPATLQTVQLAVPYAAAPDPLLAAQKQKLLLDGIAAIPGVDSVAFTSALPMGGAAFAMTDLLTAETNLDAERRQAEFRFVSPGYFTTMQIGVLLGRDLTWDDIDQFRPVALVSENVALAEWGSARAALGKLIRGSSSQDQMREVIGVVRDVRANGPSAPAARAVYVPMLTQRLFNAPVMLWRPLIYVIRSPLAGTEPFVADIRSAVSNVDSNLPLSEVRSMAEVSSTAVSRTSFTTILLSVSAGVALLLGLVGLYAAIAYTVALRNQEIGIRLALGAEPRSVARIFLRQGLLLSGMGTVLGLLVAVGASRWISSLLFGVTALDLRTYVVIPLVLMAVALVACYLPARRAAGVDPVKTLRP